MGVKWIKIVTDIFDDEKILLIESLPGADSIIVIWFKLLCLAGKNNNNGVFLLNDRIAYTDEMLSTIFRKDLKTVRLALNTFEQFNMIEVMDNVITIPNWDKYQTLDAYEKKKLRDREYQQKRREKQKILAESVKKSSDESHEKSSDVAKNRSIDIDIDKDIDIDIDISKDIKSKSAQAEICNKWQDVITKWNGLGLNKLISVNKGTKREKMLNARIRDYGIDKILAAMDNISTSDFLMGRVNDFQITFDWFIRPNNFIKVLEGNYANKQKVQSKVTRDNKASGFNNFEPRKYDYDSLERKLLGWDDESNEQEIEVAWNGLCEKYGISKVILIRADLTSREVINECLSLEDLRILENTLKESV